MIAVMRCGWVALWLTAAVGLGAAEPNDTVSLRAADEPLATVLAQVTKRAGRKLDLAVKLPVKPVDLVLRKVSLTFALQQILAGTGLEAEIHADRVVIRPAAPDPNTTTPSAAGAGAASPVRGVPDAVVATTVALARAIYDKPGAMAPLRALGWQLRALRPDWRDRLVRALPAVWAGWDSKAEALLRGARALLALGEPSAAARLAEQVTGAPALAGEAAVVLAQAAMDRGEGPDAYSYLLRQRERLHDDPDAAALSALAQFEQGDESVALANGVMAQARWPREPAVLAAVGEMLRRQGSGTPRASLLLQEALEENPLEPEALFGAAAIEARDGGDTRDVWDRFLADEPFTLRSDRVRLGAATIASTEVWDRGGNIWTFSPDGERVLYSDNFHNQLQATDARGYGLAVQLTDQEETKQWATWSPDEEWLAWTVGNAGTSVYLQGIHASGSHKAVLTAANDKLLRRTTWSTDSRLLFATEWDLTARKMRLRCYDRVAGKEVDPPKPLDRPGLGDTWIQRDGSVIGTISNSEKQCVVWLSPDGTVRQLRPWAAWNTYVAPALAPDAHRVVWYDEGSALLMVGPVDASNGTAVAVVPPSAGRGARGACWSQKGGRLAISARGQTPTVLELGGLPASNELACTLLSNPLDVATPARWRFSLARADATTTLSAVLVDDEAAETPLLANQALGAAVEVTPEAATAGPHWVRVVLSHAGKPEPPRWYGYTITPAT